MSKQTPRVIAGTVGVWLSSINGRTADRLANAADDEILHEVWLNALDMTPEWTRVGQADVTVTLDPPEQLVTRHIESLEAQRARILAEAQNQVTAIDREIQTLLAITYEPETAL